MQAPLSGTTSIYLQIANLVEDNILKDILLEEEQAPSTNELARLYAINPATAAKGLNLLADEGILYKKRGLGMFVAPGAKTMVQAKRKEAFKSTYIQPLVAEAKNLGLTQQELTHMLAEALQEPSET
ncbi:GntR family transcriptional regulator [Ruminococcaceae bacterium OttesenSCG-928-A16]|nr:GntR family transcriptional regulator [Ruminococcaceae bacterium OttesenSCG-928-A16]